MLACQLHDMDQVCLSAVSISMSEKTNTTVFFRLLSDIFSGMLLKTTLLHLPY